MRASGESIVEDVPYFLTQPLSVPKLVARHFYPKTHNDTFILNNQEYEKMIKKLQVSIHPGSLDEVYKSLVPALDLISDPVECGVIPGIWSGLRSTIVKNGEEFYKLKGVSVDAESPQTVQDGDDFIFDGGQKEANAEYEQIMSAKFNKILTENGFDTVMEYKGMWKYPGKAFDENPVASIYKIAGDTRLDELMDAIDGHYLYKSQKNETPSKVRDKLVKKIGRLYNDIGWQVGQLKKLMTDNYQTWSSGGFRTNAHVGNVVLYEKDGLIKSGLVDFDASCDTNDYSKDELIDICDKEFDQILQSSFGKISMRYMKSRSYKRDIFESARTQFRYGMYGGYREDKVQPIKGIDINRVKEIFWIIRHINDFNNDYSRSEISEWMNTDNLNYECTPEWYVKPQKEQEIRGTLIFQKVF